MPELTPEQLARQQIDAQLVACGWVVQDYKQFNPSAGRGIALREAPLKSGTCDYLLLVDRKAVGVAEAKKQGTLLSGVAEQSGHYAENLPDFIQSIAPGSLPFLYESTGVETFFRDERDPEPRSRRVFSFHRPETLAAWLTEPGTLRARLAAMPLAHPLARIGMRDCQFEANTALEQSFVRDALRSLVQMATGSPSSAASWRRLRSNSRGWRRGWRRCGGYRPTSNATAPPSLKPPAKVASCPPKPSWRV